MQIPARLADFSKVAYPHIVEVLNMSLWSRDFVSIWSVVIYIHISFIYITTDQIKHI
jgi:hypothetical protein